MTTYYKANFLPEFQNYLRQRGLVLEKPIPFLPVGAPCLAFINQAQGEAMLFKIALERYMKHIPIQKNCQGCWGAYRFSNDLFVNFPQKPGVAGGTYCLVKGAGIRRVLKRGEGAERKHAQGVRHRKGALGRILSAVEGEGVGAAPALSVDVDAANLVDQRIHQGPNDAGGSTEKARLLAVVRLGQIINDLADVIVNGHGNHRAELFFPL